MKKMKSYQFGGTANPFVQGMPMFQQSMQQQMPQVQQMANGGPVFPRAASRKDLKFWERQKAQMDRVGGEGEFEMYVGDRPNPLIQSYVEEGAVEVNRYGVKPGTGGFQTTEASDYKEQIPATFVNNQMQTPNSPFKTVDGEIFLAPLSGFQRRGIRQDKRKIIKGLKGKGKKQQATTNMFGDPAAFSQQTK